jgi:DNA gyrase subunit A
MGVRLVNLADGDVVVAVARNVESIDESEVVPDGASEATGQEDDE